MVKTIDYRIARRRMVEEQIQARGITDERVIRAFLQVPRHLFVDPALGAKAYDDCSFPIGSDQTISQPSTIAFMIQHLSIERHHKVLEIGTGSGYQTAILSLLGRAVYSIERVTALSHKAETALSRATTGSIRLKVGDGALGWPYYAPFDRIIVSASIRGRPEHLLEQLVDGGLLIAPVESSAEHIVLYGKQGADITQRRLKRCAFVPLKKGVI